MAQRRTGGSSTQLTATAEKIGAALGKVAARLDAWKRERVEITAEVQKIIRAGHAILSELGGTSGSTGASGPAPPPNKGGRPKGYKMSEETKRKLRAAWKRRKAADKPSAPGA